MLLKIAFPFRSAALSFSVKCNMATWRCSLHKLCTERPLKMCDRHRIGSHICKLDTFLTTYKFDRLSMELVHTCTGWLRCSFKKGPVCFWVQFRCDFQIKKSHLNRRTETHWTAAVKPQPHMCEPSLTDFPRSLH